MKRTSKSTSLAAPGAAGGSETFRVANLGTHAWAVAYAQQLIPGAILRTREAAIKYVTDIAQGAGLDRVKLDIIEGAALQATRH